MVTFIIVMAERGFLFGVGYPLYSVCRWRDDDVFMIAGGGGKAKTGIKNGVVCFNNNLKFN